MAETVTRQKVKNVLKRLGNKPITLENVLTILKRSLLPQEMVLFLQDITHKRYEGNNDVSMKDKIHLIVDLGEECSDKKAENNLDYLIRMGMLDKLKGYGKVVAVRGTKIERYQISVAHQYCWHCLIESEWKEKCRKNLPPAIFEKLFPHFMHNLDETCLKCSNGVLKVISDGY